jgi:hypothetical protein
MDYEREDEKISNVIIRNLIEYVKTFTTPIRKKNLYRPLRNERLIQEITKKIRPKYT